MKSSKPTLRKDKHFETMLRSIYSVLLISLFGLISCISIFLLTGNTDVVVDIFDTLKLNTLLALENLISLDFDALLDQWFQGLFSLLILGIIGLPAVLFLHLTSPKPGQSKFDQ